MQRPVQQQGGDDCCVRPGPFVPGPVKNTGQSSGSMPAKRWVQQANFSRDYESPTKENEDPSGGLPVTETEGLNEPQSLRTDSNGEEEEGEEEEEGNGEE